MPDLTPEALAELRRLAEAATPGPWVSGDPDFGSRNAQCIVSISDRAMGRDIQGPNLRPALFDVEYIAAANPAAVLALLDAAAERDALAATVARVRALVDWHETKADKARRFRIEINGQNPVMDKAAEVHADAARRLRAALDEESQP